MLEIWKVKTEKMMQGKAENRNPNDVLQNKALLFA